MSENIGKKTGYENLTPGNPGNSGGGRPTEEFRRECGEKLDHWLKRASTRLAELDQDAEKDQDVKFKVVEAAGKLAERFGKYTGLEKSEVIGDKSLHIIIRDETIEPNLPEPT